MLDTSGSSRRAESPQVGDREPFGDRGIPMINPPLVALALAVAFLVALLVVVLVRRDQPDAAGQAARAPGIAHGQPVAGTPDQHDSLVSVLYGAPTAEVGRAPRS
ncbi:MAG TPA: hypothetical protein VKD21_14950 [Acidimicrobiales bacterium]|nr:hypothetical protein [Acidimicrobiales bacterium]